MTLILVAVAIVAAVLIVASRAGIGSRMVVETRDGRSIRGERLFRPSVVLGDAEILAEPPAESIALSGDVRIPRREIVLVQVLER